MLQPVQPLQKDSLKAIGVFCGNQVAVCGELHAGDQGERWRTGDVLVTGLPQTARGSQPNGFIHEPAVIERCGLKHLCDPVDQRLPGRNRGEGSDEQEDAQIGVVGDDAASRFDGVEEGLAEGLVGGLSDAGGGGGGGAEEILDGRVGEGVPGVDVAGFRAEHFKAAGGLEPVCQLLLPDGVCGSVGIGQGMRRLHRRCLVDEEEFVGAEQDLGKLLQGCEFGVGGFGEIAGGGPLEEGG